MITLAFANATPQHKDSVFRDFFNNPNRLLLLCNSLLHTNYSEINDIEINTLDSNFSNELKNSISCKLGNYFLVIFDYLGIPDKNVPFACLTDFSNFLKSVIPEKDLKYRTDLIHLPSPKFFVFYNDENETTKQVADFLSLDSPQFKLKVQPVNLNLNFHSEIFNRCNYLRDYSTLIFYVKQGLNKNLSPTLAIRQAIDDCISKNIMKDYLVQKREWILAMLDFQISFEHLSY